MSSDFKSGTRKALESYFLKDLKRNVPKKAGRKNASPEKDFVTKELMPYLKKRGFSVQVIESKATYSERAGRYISQSAEPGTPDIQGITPKAIGCFIEAKAPGKLSSIRPAQYEYLKEKISRGAFAVCTDSIRHFEQIYDAWSLMADTQDQARYLISKLPVPKECNTEDAPLFEGE